MARTRPGRISSPPLDGRQARLRRAWDRSLHDEPGNQQPGVAPKQCQPGTHQPVLSPSCRRARRYFGSTSVAGIKPLLRVTQAQKKVIDNELRDLPGRRGTFSGQKARFKQLSERLAPCRPHSTTTCSMPPCLRADHPGPHQLSGIPEDVLEAAHKAAEESGKEGGITLQMPSYLPVSSMRTTANCANRLYYA